MQINGCQSYCRLLIREEVTSKLRPKVQARIYPGKRLELWESGVEDKGGRRHISGRRQYVSIFKGRRL